jgi:DHA1 family tetracycline resistance protein-like MFS transporter
MESTFTMFAERHLAMAAGDVGNLLGLAGIVGIVVQGGLIRPLVKRFGEPPLVPVGLVLLAIGMVAMPFLARGPLLQLDFAIVATGQGFAQPTLQALISRSAGAGEQGSVLGSAQSMSALARVVGPGLGGILFGASEASLLTHARPFLFSAVLLTLAALLAVPATSRAVAARAAAAKAE